MKVVYQNSCYCTVRRQQDQLMAETIILSTDYEAAANLVVDVYTFKIESARWDVYRSPEGYAIIGREITELYGLEAFMQAGPHTRKLLEHEMNGLVLSMVNECVKGLIQAETYVYKERGYASAQEYDQHWRTFNTDYCHYFTNIDRLSSYWSEYLGYCIRDRNLFNRSHLSTFYRKPEGGLVVTSSFTDSFHEIGLVLELTDEGGIVDCQGNFLRGPDKVCFENKQHLSRLIGKNLKGISKKALAADVGGRDGCFHVLDMVYQISQLLETALKY